MQKISIGGFNSAGINTDINPSDLGESYLTRANNVRMINGGITPFGGTVRQDMIPDDKVPRSINYVDGKNGKIWIIICDDDVYAYNSNFVSVKPDSLSVVHDADKWSSFSISGLPIINNPSIGPFFKDDASDKFMPLIFKGSDTWQSKKQLCDVMAVHKQFIFALGITDDGKYYPEGVRWSSPADIGAIPDNWDELDTTSTAGLTNLGGSGGPIVGGLSMRDSFVVYRESGITIFDYVGGMYVWRIRNLESDVGLIARRAVVDVNGTHYFMSVGDIYINDGNTVKSIANDRIRRLLNSIDKDNFVNSFAIHNVSKKEVWFCSPLNNQLYSNVAFIYNYEYDSWVQRDLPNAISADSGYIATSDSIWDNESTKWDSSNKSWSDNATNPFDIVTVALCKNIDNTFSMELIDFPAGFNYGAFSSIIERTDLPLGGIDKVNTITRVYPHAVGTSVIRIQLGSQAMPGGPVLWKPPVDFRPSVDRKVDIRTTGNLHAYRILANDVSSNFILTGLDFEYTEAGTR